MTAVSGWVGDFDAGQLDAQAISASLGDCSHVLHTTHSHSPATPKWRLIVPYARPVTVEEHARLYDYFASLYGDAVDTSTRDPCRLWYFPSCAADTEHLRELHVRPGAGLFDPDAVLGIIQEDAPDATLPQRPNAGAAAHPNDALAYHPEFEKPTTDEVRRMLSYVRLEDAPGKRRGPWLEILQGLHDWDDGGEQGFQLIHEWSETQPGYVDEADVRKIWDSCRGKGITIATVIKRAIEGGYTREVDEEVIDTAEGETRSEHGSPIRLDGGVRSIKEQIEQEIASGKGKAQAALSALEANLIYVADQQEYYSISHRSLVTKDAIRQLYKAGMPKKADGSRMDPCKLLENSITKRIVSSMGYHPGEGEVYFEHGRALANCHHAYHVEPIPGTPYELDLFQQLIAHLFPRPEDRVFCNYLLQLLAHAVQKPGIKIGSAPLLFSTEQGTGKSTMLFEVPLRLFGALNTSKVSNGEMDSGFSDWLAKTHFIHLDEVYMGGMRQGAAVANKFKPYVTDSLIRVHPKGFAGYNITNRLVITACSNFDSAVHLTDQDRRWAVHEVCGGKLDKGFAQALYTFLDSPRGPGVLKHIFLNIPLAGFNPHADAPMTREKREMIEVSRPALQRELLEMIAAEEPPFHRQVLMLEELQLAIRNRGPRFAGTSMNELASVLKAQPIKANKLPGRRYMPKGARRIIWATKNAEAWAAVSTEAILTYLRTGELPPEVPAERQDEPPLASAPAAPVHPAQVAQTVAAEH